jgi:hypothetical protein
MKSGFNMGKVRRFRRLVAAGSRGPLRPVFKQWGIRYLAWTKRLFYIKSRGGTAEGVAWEELSPRTIRNRNRRRGSRRVRSVRGERERYSILVDRLGTIPKAMTPHEKGNIFRYLHDGIRVGFGGSAEHPEGKATIADIAIAHNVGKGEHLPIRQILHLPNRALAQSMRNDLKRGVERIGRRT